MKIELSRTDCIAVLEAYALSILSGAAEKYTASMSTGDYTLPHEVTIDIVPTITGAQNET